MRITNVQNQLHPTQALIPLNVDAVKYIVVHHTASGLGYTWEDCNADHKANTWACCGYNEMIYANGDVYVCRGLHVGAQCQGSNSISYGISLVGNFDTTTMMPTEQFASLMVRIRALRVLFPNFESIKGHKELFDTTCPGVYCNMDIIKEYGMMDE